MSIRTCILASTIWLFFTFPVAAEEIDHVGCTDMESMAYVGKLGIVNEEALQEQIDKTDKSLTKLRLSPAKSTQRRSLLKVHLRSMQKAMKEMHNLKLSSGCSQAAHGASIETRMGVVEKRLDMIQSMMEQMLGHQQERDGE